MPVWGEELHLHTHEHSVDSRTCNKHKDRIKRWPWSEALVLPSWEEVDQKDLLKCTKHLILAFEVITCRLNSGRVASNDIKQSFTSHWSLFCHMLSSKSLGYRINFSLSVFECVSLTHTHTHRHICTTFHWNIISSASPLLSVPKVSRMIWAWAAQMEIVSLKKPHFLWDSFIYADLNRASPLNRDS